MQVVVVGAGPAGLAAAERLADAGVRVSLVTVGHILGGKAASWTRADGRTAEHGQHITLGFYRQLPELLARSGVDPDLSRVSSEGHFYVYEARDDQVHHLHLAQSSPRALFAGVRYTGWTAKEKAGFSRLLLQAMPRIMAGTPQAWDDECLTAWCLQRGFPISAVNTGAFRATRDAQLNWPGEISAYAMLQAVRAAGRDFSTAEMRIPAGGMSAIWWDPIAARIEALGGRVVRYRKLVGLKHAAGRLTGLVFAAPPPHPVARPHTMASVPTVAGSEELWTDFDAVICTLPAPALAELLDPDLHALPGLVGVKHLTSVAPLGLHVWHRNRTHMRHQTVVMGLPPPLGYVVDNQRIYHRYRDDPQMGAALHFVGQETAFEHDDDQTIFERAMASVAGVPGFEQIDMGGVLDWELVRNRGPHKRYWNAEPGSLRHKPWPEPGLAGLYLAGDWVRSELDFPCMENAVRSGRQTAAIVLKAFRRRS